MNLLAHIADRVLGRPLFLHPAKAQIILSVIADRIGVDPIENDIPPELIESLSRPASSRLVGEPAGPVDAQGRRKLLYMQDGGVALIPIVGSLVNRGAWVGDDGSGLTSYEGLDRQISAARDDPNMRAILLDIDSPGGEAGGMFTLAETIRGARDFKPVVAHVNDWAMSAAYGIASAANEIIASPTSEVGSIGTVMMHVDRSHELEKRGRRVTLIHAGAHKVDGNQFEPLSPAVRAELQRIVNEYNERFIEIVVAGRGRMLLPQAIRDMEAGIFMGQRAREVGLVDRIGSFNETLTRLKRGAGKGAFSMDQNINPSATGGRMYSQAEFDAAQTEAREARADARLCAEQLTEAVATARRETIERVRGILRHEHAEGRADQAMMMALETELSVEEAGRLLAVSPSTKGAPALTDRGAAPLPGDNNRSKAESTSSRWDRALARAGAKL